MSELVVAPRVLESRGVIEHRIFSLGLDELGGSALTGKNLVVPECGTERIPVAFVTARNTVFLSYALAWAQVIDASVIYIGVDSLDYPEYPDCRPAHINAAQSIMDLATQKVVEGSAIVLHAPLIEKSKADIVKTGMGLEVDDRLNISCYHADAEGNACGLWDSCRLRKQGFTDA